MEFTVFRNILRGKQNHCNSKYKEGTKSSRNIVQLSVLRPGFSDKLFKISALWSRWRQIWPHNGRVRKYRYILPITNMLLAKILAISNKPSAHLSYCPICVLTVSICILSHEEPSAMTVDTGLGVSRWRAVQRRPQAWTHLGAAAGSFSTPHERLVAIPPRRARGAGNNAAIQLRQHRQIRSPSLTDLTYTFMADGLLFYLPLSVSSANFWR